MPLFVFSVESNVRAAERTVDDVAKKQIPYRTSLAVSRIAKEALADLQKEMVKVFDRPKPYTLNAFYVKNATVKSQTAEIRARDSAGPKGTPGWKFLTPEIMGGTRRLKRFERALQAKFGTAFAEPGSGARLDQYGNISQGDITRILSALGAFQEHGYRANRKNLSRAQRKAQGADGSYKRPPIFHRLCAQRWPTGHLSDRGLGPSSARACDAQEGAALRRAVQVSRDD